MISVLPTEVQASKTCLNKVCFDFVVISGVFEGLWWKLNLTKFQDVGGFMGFNRIAFPSIWNFIYKNLQIQSLSSVKMRKKSFSVRWDRSHAYCNRNRYFEVHFALLVKSNNKMPKLVKMYFRLSNNEFNCSESTNLQVLYCF